MDVAKALYYLDEVCTRALLDGYGALDRERASETLDPYHLCFVLELWCWMAQMGKRKQLDRLSLETCSAG